MFVKDESLLRDTNNFQIFMTIMSEKEAADKKFAVQQVCTLLFPKYKVIMTPRSVLLSGEGITIQIDESNFEYLQEILK
jgi:hypothetical protein